MPFQRAAVIAGLVFLVQNVIASPAPAKAKTTTTRAACDAPVVTALKNYKSSAAFCTSFDQINTQTEYTVAWASSMYTWDADCVVPTTSSTPASSASATPTTSDAATLNKRAKKTNIPGPLRKYKSASLSSACDCLSFPTPTVTSTETRTATTGPPYCTGQAVGPLEVTVDIAINDNYLGGSTVYWNGYSPDEYVLTGGLQHSWFQLYNDGTYAYVADPIEGGVLNFTTDNSGAGYKLHCDLEIAEHVVCYNANYTSFLYYVLDNDNTTMRLGLTLPPNATKHQLYWGY